LCDESGGGRLGSLEEVAMSTAALVSGRDPCRTANGMDRGNG